MSNILVGVTGGIAAYKSAYLVREFIKAGHNVKVMMTKKAESFVGHTTFEALSLNPVLRDDYTPTPISHIDYASWADICIIAPATANIIGKINAGIADNELLSTILALKCPLVLAPAMNTNMYNNIIVQENIKNLQSKGIYMILPAEGLLACQTEGAGKMQEPEIIAKKVINILNNGSDSSLKIENDMLSGLNILITAGPTKEYIDPVRYITNKSSGKMGYALAEEAYKMGANVTLISGEVNISSDIPNIHKVVSAEDMYNAFLSFYESADIMIMAAAVGDYAPVYENNKIKKNNDEMILSLKKTKDILSYAGSHKKDNQILVGFAAETNNLEEYAAQKLSKKHADIIAANDVSRKDIGFDSDNNEMTLFFANGNITHTGLQSKKDIAKIILAESAILYNEKNS
ncbi:MAG: bifunctional phosphopantothenoylcysteine decarboxylase/phosphopantothenate--cysteine ligase CoaBC [Candidatus Mucispirillum faecigallinarum]|nr:bifunctional phosphopantothenoylcysteine decarboxylase/phosphopantothenate--cysteine ligase CoaBC [Candidatus Mucispirillum faecigallinarum]